ncbi:B12 binding protein [Motilibacter rhizosphaerae]|uniref:B12 binding protein n=1 Tax=Motilibacter rhizosphaerae TaxID=598652 RepID=A0A4Q7NTJ1_9ACTN|nr:B12 binding protein [Motilibacter rhizosphaerae]
MGDPAVPALTVAAVARRLGVAPATLRTWDRRYQLGPSGHTAGAHRRYTPEDLDRLTLMRRLVLEGVAPADAARLAHEQARTAAEAADAEVEPPDPEPLLASVTTLTTGAQEAPEAGARPGPAGGGRVLALPHGSAASRGLARAAMSLDPHACSSIVQRALSEHGVIATWDELVVPVLRGVGERWAETGEGIEVEHLLSEVLLGALRLHVPEVASPVNGRPVLLACTEEDQHSLPLHALAAALAERRCSSRVLGARVPARALADAVRRTGPAVVFVWAQTAQTADPAMLRALPLQRPGALVVSGGPGWAGVRHEARVEHASSLGDAVRVVIGAVTAARG